MVGLKKGHIVTCIHSNFIKIVNKGDVAWNAEGEDCDSKLQGCEKAQKLSLPKISTDLIIISHRYAVKTY